MSSNFSILSNAVSLATDSDMSLHHTAEAPMQDNPSTYTKTAVQDNLWTTFTASAKSCMEPEIAASPKEEPSSVDQTQRSFGTSNCRRALQQVLHVAYRFSVRPIHNAYN